MRFVNNLNLEKYPHTNITFTEARKSSAWITYYTNNFDCTEEKQFYYVIKDEPYNPESVDKKKRYEVRKGNKNFYVQVINPYEYEEELYDCYVESLNGYKNKKPEEKENFKKYFEAWHEDRCKLFAVFDRESKLLCGYADIYINGKYLPISSLKTRPSFERKGVNAALVCGICEYFKEDLQNGSYLCDGSRNALHETHFQDYLIKYFQFRRCYCDLHLIYRFPLNILVKIVYPFRKIIKQKKLKGVLRLEAWSRQKEE